MSGEKNENEPLLDVITRLTNLVIFLLVLVVGLCAVVLHYLPDYVPEKNGDDLLSEYNAMIRATTTATLKKVQVNTSNEWIAPEISDLEENSEKALILYGKELVVNTSYYFGPQGKFRAYAANGMNCQNCHLEAGTKAFGNNFSAVASTYPKYRPRSGTTEQISKRVNDCIERSLNGNKIDTASHEMLSIVAYIKWLGKDIDRGVRPPGAGFKEMVFLEREADPSSGKIVYGKKCQSCHQSNGAGLFNQEGTTFKYPPLWGERSFNTGAGLFRMSNFARFVRYNMPVNGSDSSTMLTDEEAWDVSAYVLSQPHPQKIYKLDWPVVREKPFDHPFGPFADNFSEKQHKYGPFKPIVEQQLALQKGKK